uniref:eRF1 domain-containing protein n=1 Tax=Fagus sylvatica TaxID=28930 RepID=A0A2N9H7W2_FAGSY
MVLLGMRRRNGESEEIGWSGEGQAFREREGGIGATGSTGKVSFVQKGFILSLVHRQHYMRRTAVAVASYELYGLVVDRHNNCMRRTAELATQYFIDTSTNQPTVSGLILAGTAEFMTELSQSNILSRVKFFQEKCLIRKFFELIIPEDTESTDSNKKQVFAVIGLDETSYALCMGVVETLIVWEKYLNHEQAGVQEVRSFLEWSAQFRCKREFVSDQSYEGLQFCQGLGGIGAILRVQKSPSPGNFVKILVSIKMVRMKDEEDGEIEPKLKAILNLESD